MKNTHKAKEPEDFSLVLGGPLFQLLLRMRLITPGLGLLKKRIIVIALFAWLPLLLLSIFGGRAWGNVGIPFLSDIESQARFLLALPLLIAAEVLVHKELRRLVEQFVTRGIISKKVLPKFNEVIASSIKLRNSMKIEIFLLLLVFVAGHYIWNTVSVLDKAISSTGSWYGVVDDTGRHLSLAGYWYVFISMPIFQFIALRWYFRIFIWARFLWKTSRFELNLVPTHSDRACGLGFLSLISEVFAPLIFAHGVLLAGLLANSIFFGGVSLQSLILPIAAVVVFLILVMMGPLLAFLPTLVRTRRTGLLEYGVLASMYVEEFDLKWLRGGAARSEPLIGSPDIQSLADISNSYQVIRAIRSFPFNNYTIMQTVGLTLLPVLPLVLTVVPMDKLVSKLLGLIF